MNDLDGSRVAKLRDSLPLLRMHVSLVDDRLVMKHVQPRIGASMILSPFCLWPDFNISTSRKQRKQMGRITSPAYLKNSSLRKVGITE